MPQINRLFILKQDKAHFLILAAIWLFSQLLFIKYFGIVSTLEASKYIEQAHYFLQTGKYTSDQFTFYSTQILLLAFCIKTGLGLVLAVLIQMFFNALSVYFFYKLIFKLTDRKALALGGTIIFLFQFFYHLYNVYLFTESLFFSFSVLYAYYLFTLKKLSFKSILTIVAFLILLYFTRPMGIFFIPSTFLFVILKFFPKNAFKIVTSSAIGGLAALSFLLNYSLGAGGEFNFLLPYSNEQVICGVSTIHPPHQLLVKGDKNSIEGLWYIITHFSDLFFKLGIKRLGAFFGMIRSHFSLAHNIYIAVYFYSLYLIIILGVNKTFKKSRKIFLFAFSLVGFTALTVMLSCDEWHNRFMFAVFPTILLTAILSLHYLFPTKLKNSFLETNDDAASANLNMH